MISHLTRDSLLNVGFLDVAAWHMVDGGIDYRLDGDHASADQLLFEQPNALYAFVLGDNVQYIGKTSRSIRRRFVPYRKPGKTQPTNLRCNAKIKQALAADDEIRILVFAPISELRYLEFEINLAAALEDSLIKSFAPPWNGREKGKPITEEAERETVDECTAPDVASPPVLSISDQRTAEQSLASFEILLGKAYYSQGIINPGVDASQHLGLNGEPIQILFDDGTEAVFSSINRSANPSGSVRVVGGNRRIAEWFQHHFKMGDIVEAKVLDRNRILVISPKGSRIA